MFESINPATGQTVAERPAHTADEVAARLERAAAAAAHWAGTPLDERVGALARLGDLLDSQQEELAALITTEMGKPIAQARSEVEKCAWACRHYAGAAAGYLEPVAVDVGDRTDFVRFDPIGIVFAIMPWNYPFWQVVRFLAPITAAGNVVVLKHAAATMGCGEAIADLATSAGFPAGVVQTLRIDHDVAAEVIADTRVRGVTFTGSTAGGRVVGGLAGSNVKRSVLELGGSDAFIVLEDADVEAAAAAAVRSRLLNNGQSCVSAKRFLVVPSIADAFVAAAEAEMAAATTGDPMDAGTDVGPLAREDLRSVLDGQIARSVDAGARPVIAGGTMEGDGFFFAPSLLVDVQPDHAVANEETFGPVAAVSVVEDDDAAVQAANASEYGLGASVWTRDEDRGRAVAARLEAGVVSINDIVKSDPRLPFGGVKSSGYGRELGSYGMHEFTNIKTVHHGPPPASPAQPAEEQS